MLSIVQALVLFYVIELLQRATVVLRTKADLTQVCCEVVQHCNNAQQTDSHDELDDPSLISKTRATEHKHGADLHYIGQQFLTSEVAKKIFDISVILHLYVPTKHTKMQASNNSTKMANVYFLAFQF